MRRFLLTTLLVSILSPIGAGIGAAPAVVDAGTIQRGEVKEVALYAYDNQREAPFPIRPTVSEPLYSEVFQNSLFPSYQYSEEPIDSWFRFSKNTYVLDPDNTTTVVLGSGDAVNANAIVRLLIDVPDDAEPGYHAGKIRFNPDLQGGEGSGANVVASPVIQVFFRVPGEVQRSIAVQDMRGFRVAEDRLRIDTTVQNTGTVTTTLRSGDIMIDGADQEALIDMNTETLNPGEYATITSFWNANALDAGQYQAEANISWGTGQVTRQASIPVPESIEIVEGDDTPDGTAQTAAEREPFPTWLVVMVLVVLGVLMYGLNIAPIWILATVGFIGVSLYILLSPVANLLLILPLIIFAGAVYAV